MKRPRCPICKSYRVELPAHASLHWRTGRWVLIKGSVMDADGAPFYCQDCGQGLVNETGPNPPFDLYPEPGFTQILERTTVDRHNIDAGMT